MADDDERMAKIRKKWESKLGNTRVRTERVQAKVSEIKGVKEFTKNKTVPENFNEKWNDNCPQMYFKGYNRKPEGDVLN